MKWVTCHWSIMGGVQDVVVHKDKDTATKYFKTHYRYYFSVAGTFKVDLPCTYGYAHRKFIGMSKAKFEKMFGKMKGVTE